MGSSPMRSDGPWLRSGALAVGRDEATTRCTRGRGKHATGRHCSIGLGFLQGRAEPQVFLRDPELPGQLAPHPLSGDCPALPGADRCGLDPEQQAKLRLGQVSGLADLANLVHTPEHITGGCELTTRYHDC